MKALVYTHDACLLHDAGPGHPERPERLVAARAGVDRWGGPCEQREPHAATIDELALVHDPAYVDLIREFCAVGGGPLDADTTASPGSWEAALRAAGAGLDAVDALGRGDGDFAFLAVRPPGHHALVARAMGFCLFNNIAITAERLTREGSRVAIVDWDVHHGNGTQSFFYRRHDVLYISLHEFPFYPGTGAVTETGKGAGTGFSINVALPPGAGGDAYGTAFARIVMPALTEFDADWILVSAGYDAHRADPLAGLRLEAADYGALSGALAALGTPVVLFLEGGYDLAALEESVAATMAGLSGERFEFSDGSPPAAMHMIDLCAAAAATHWRNVQAP